MLHSLQESATHTLELQDILATDARPPLNLENFRKYCKSQYNQENIEFYLDSTEEKVKGNEEEIQRLKEIYIEENGFFGLNLDSGIRTNTLKDTSKYPFGAARKAIFHLMATDIFPRFLRFQKDQAHVNMAKTMARWWKKDERKRLTLNYFFSFPDIINDAESRSHALFCSILLTLIIILQTFQKSVVWIGLYLCYGFVARAACGSRIDPQAHFVLFIVIPIRDWLNTMINSKGTNRQIWFRNEFKAGIPKRCAQIIGAVMSICGVTLLLCGNYAANPLPLWIGGYVFLGCVLFASTLQWSCDICLACIVVYYVIDHEICPRDSLFCRAIELENSGIAFAYAYNHKIAVSVLPSTTVSAVLDSNE